MSLYLPEQKLGSHSTEGGSSNKFILKGRQTGTMHRGHSWVFRAESHDTMMAWYEDIKALTEKSPEERSQFVQNHSRSLSRSSRRSVDSDGLLDEDDDEPFSASSQIDVNPEPKPEATARRAQPGGRFPSDIQVNAQRGLQAPHSPSSVNSGPGEQPQDSQAMVTGAFATEPIATGAHAQGQEHPLGYGGVGQTPMGEIPSHAAAANQEAQHDGVNPYTSEPMQASQPSQPQYGGAFVAPMALVGGEKGKAIDDGSTEHTDLTTTTDLETPIQTPTTSTDMRSSDYRSGVNVLGVSAGGFPKSESSQEQSAVPSAELPGTSAKAMPLRPTNNTSRMDSANSVSNLHVPGQYPRGSMA